MTLAIRKFKCWVNAILPITFIKETNKLVTLRMEHDQQANLKSPPLSSFFVTLCVFASFIPEPPAASMSNTILINL